MAKVATAIQSQFVLALGDNFYSSGVTSSTSARFKETWEDVYIGAHSLDTKWFVIGGNHDHYGNITAQIDYTQEVLQHDLHMYGFHVLYLPLLFDPTTSSSQSAI
jgi:tartrate-resistant acid phosphatase type 5